MHFSRSLSFKPNATLQQLEKLIEDNNTAPQKIQELISARDDCQESIDNYQLGINFLTHAKQHKLQNTDRMNNLVKHFTQDYTLCSKEQIQNALKLIRIVDSPIGLQPQVDLELQKIDTQITQSEKQITNLTTLIDTISKAISEYEVLSATLDAAKVVANAKNIKENDINAIIVDLQTALEQANSAEQIAHTEIDKIQELADQLSKDSKQMNNSSLPSARHSGFDAS